MVIVDFFLVCLVMFYSMVRFVEYCWYFGEVFCKIYISIDIMLSLVFILYLFFIFIDRYYVVCDLLRYKVRIGVLVIFMMIFISWSIFVFFVFGMIFLELNFKGVEELYYKYVYCMGYCVVFFSKIFGVFVFMIFFYIFGFIMLCVYYRIYFIVKGYVRLINDVNKNF